MLFRSRLFMKNVCRFNLLIHTQRGLKPIDNFWEDGSSLYKIHLVDFIEIRKLLEYE